MGSNSSFACKLGNSDDCSIIRALIPFWAKVLMMISTATSGSGSSYFCNNSETVGNFYVQIFSGAGIIHSGIGAGIFRALTFSCNHRIIFQFCLA